MGLLDDLGKLLDSVEAPMPVDLISGVRGAWTDVPSLAKDVFGGDVHAAVNDGRKVLGDADDIVQGLSSLGVSMGPVPSALSNSTVMKLAESKVLSAAQLAIEGLKKTTGSGAPCTGEEFRGSSERLNQVVSTLIDAEPHGDRWDGTAAQVYAAVNASHRRCVSDMQVADLAIAEVIDIEAGQVARTRTTLDDASRNLTDYDLATAWMNATPPTAAMKFAMDVAAAGAAMATVNATMAVLVKNSVENAMEIRAQLDFYANSSADTSGNPEGGCDVFAAPDEDHPLARPDDATPLPDPADGTRTPTRSHPDAPFTVPAPETPAPPTPATPYGATPPATP